MVPPSGSRACSKEFWYVVYIFSLGVYPWNFLVFVFVECMCVRERERERAHTWPLSGRQWYFYFSFCFSAHKDYTPSSSPLSSVLDGDRLSLLGPLLLLTDWLEPCRVEVRCPEGRGAVVVGGTVCPQCGQGSGRPSLGPLRTSSTPTGGAGGGVAPTTSRAAAETYEATIHPLLILHNRRFELTLWK